MTVEEEMITSEKSHYHNYVLLLELGAVVPTFDVEILAV